MQSAKKLRGQANRLYSMLEARLANPAIELKTEFEMYHSEETHP